MKAEIDPNTIQPLKAISGGPVALLLKKLEEARTRNPRLSQRAFALKLGLSSGAFSEILQGKRALTHQQKIKMAPKLQLSPKEEVTFFANSGAALAKPSQTHLQELKLSTDQFHLISDWWHFAILNLTLTRGFKPQVGWIARRLGLPNKIVNDAWERLFRLEYLEKKGEKVFRRHPQMSTSDGLFDLSIQKAHLEDLKLIEKSLFEVPMQLRDNFSQTMPINKKDLPKAKELLRVFHDQFAANIEALDGDEVYRLSFAFFPLTIVQEEQ